MFIFVVLFFNILDESVLDLFAMEEVDHLSEIELSVLAPSLSCVVFLLNVDLVRFSVYNML